MMKDNNFGRFDPNCTLEEDLAYHPDKRLSRAGREPSERAHALTMKGMALLGRDDALDKAYDYFRQAHEADPDHLDTRDTMNWAEGLAVGVRRRGEVMGNGNKTTQGEKTP